MILASLKRLKDGDQEATTGDLWTPEDLHWFTLEPSPPVIPTGIYEVKVTPSPRFTAMARDPNSPIRKLQAYNPVTATVRLPLLLDVPGHDGIRIHPLNFAGESEGCIGVGRVLNGDSIEQSDAAFDEFCAWLDNALRSDSVYLDIGWAA